MNKHSLNDVTYVAGEKTSLSLAILHSFPGIGEYTTQTIQAYHEQGWLNKMLTTIVIHPDKKWVKMLNRFAPRLIKKFKHRYYQGLSSDKIKSYPLKEIIRLISIRVLSISATDKIWEWAETAYDAWAAKQLNRKIKLVHAYEHAALSTFQRAEALGIIKLLEQTSQHYSFLNKIVEEQLEKYPLLRSSHSDIIAGKLSLKRNQRKEKELLLADFILCNSTFTRHTLIEGGVPPEKIITIPLGFPPPANTNNIKKLGSKVIFLNAGSQSIRKGIHILCEAWKICGFKETEAALWLIGSNLLPDEITNNLLGDVQRRDFIPKDDLMQLMKEADVFVFPTLADGFGLVITESMSKGLPVIASNNSAGPDLITDEYDGLLVEAGNVEDLAAKMRWCVENKSELNLMGLKAIEKAKSWQWSDYRTGLIDKINERVNVEAE